MADNILQFLQTASFRGIAFKFIAHQQQGGRKSINYEYPNQNSRFVEDMGQYPKVYDMNCYINSQDIDYYAQREIFVNALSREGAGILIHPFDGAVNVQAKPYNLTESIEELGYAVFRVQFFQTTSALFPSGFQVASALIEGQFTNFLSNLNSDFNSNWKVSTNNFNNLSYATNTLLANSATIFESLPVNSPSATTDQLASYNSSVALFNDNKVTNAQDSTSLSTSLADIFNNAGDLSSVLSEQIAVIESLFNFSSASPIDSATTIQDERELDRQILNQYINALALYYDYLFIASQTFETQTDIENKSTQLTQQFSVVVLNNTYTNVNNEKFELLSTETLSLIQNARTSTHNYLNALTVDSRRLVEINISRTSLLPFTYLYYGELDLLSTLYDLNNINNAANISGDFFLLTNENSDSN